MQGWSLPVESYKQSLSLGHTYPSSNVCPVFWGLGGGWLEELWRGGWSCRPGAPMWPTLVTSSVWHQKSCFLVKRTFLLGWIFQGLRGPGKGQMCRLWITQTALWGHKKCGVLISKNMLTFGRFHSSVNRSIYIFWTSHCQMIIAWC